MLNRLYLLSRLSSIQSSKFVIALAWSVGIFLNLDETSLTCLIEEHPQHALILRGSTQKIAKDFTGFDFAADLTILIFVILFWFQRVLNLRLQLTVVPLPNCFIRIRILTHVLFLLWFSVCNRCHLILTSYIKRI